MKNNLQEKFEDFGSIPSNDVWAEIEHQLNQKKKRRALFFWFSSGLAACFIGLFLLINFKTSESSLASKTIKPNLNSNKKDINPSDKLSSSDTLNTKKETLTTTKFPENQNKEQNLKSEREIFRTKSYKINIPNFSEELNELSHQIEVKYNEQKVDSAQILVQTEIAKRDSLAEGDSLIYEIKISPEKISTNLPHKDSLEKRNKWSLEFALSTWDAFQNKDQNVSLNSSSDSETAFWAPPTNQLNTASSNNSIANIRKPLSLNFALNYRTSKNWLFSTGVNFDYMFGKTISGSSISQSDFISFGLPLGLGYVFRSDKSIKFIPKIANISDFMFFQSESALNGINQTLDPISNSKKLGYQNSLQIDLNFAYTLNAKSQLTLSPNFKYYLVQNLNLGNTHILKRDFWYGIKIGYQYNF